MATSAESQDNVAEYTVSELSGALKRTVEDAYGYVRVRGEISGYRGPHSSGHCYFALKDDKAKIDAIIWRGVFGKLRFRPEEGMEVVASGKLTTYPGRSSYQIVIESLEPAGAGALMALLEERKRKLAAEGLFGEDRKRPLPFLPAVIGVVTSPTGAVIRDILHRLADRFPRHVLVWPVRVQGETSAREVAAAIAGFNAISPGGPVPRPDLLIVARGGGSIEELWSFNEEEVVRAAAASAIPLISAVGHETDWTLLDLVADCRAPTPTAAAEMAVPVRLELIAATDDLARRARAGSLRYLGERRAALRSAARALPRLTELLALPRQRFDIAAGLLGRALIANTTGHRTRLDRVSGRLAPALAANAHAVRVRFARCAARLAPAVHRARIRHEGARIADLAARAARALSQQIARRHDRLEARAGLLASLSYENVLRRGYALVRDAKGAMLKRAAAVAPGAKIELEFADGRLKATADGPAAPASPSGAQSAPATGKAKPAGQGSLF
ncbi:MAG: exodeoxyribonuclease VII large subunit [Rhodobiaceae bacterium]|nr:exodeoxyribonuclease VII large subunit [Rhodobiaceae bacterium]